EGSGARGAQHRSVQAAAIERLGLADPERGATGLRGIGRAASACLARAARWHARARGPLGAGASLFRFSADTGKARSAWLGRRGHFCAFLVLEGRFTAAAAPFRSHWRPVSEVREPLRQPRTRTL